MKTITVKYEGGCKKCGQSIPVGANAIYERRIGIFCPTCAPVNSEDIREYRQEAADKKADKYDEWASKREITASAKLNSYPEIRHDWAFITQPGRIPFRDRMNKSDERACESLQVAKGMREKASSLRHVQIAGDADKARQAKREWVLSWIKVGMEVETFIYGRAIVKKINKKTAQVAHSNNAGDWATNIEISFLQPIQPQNKS